MPIERAGRLAGCPSFKGFPVLSSPHSLDEIPEAWRGSWDGWMWDIAAQTRLRFPICVCLKCQTDRRKVVVRGFVWPRTWIASSASHPEPVHPPNVNKSRDLSPTKSLYSFMYFIQQLTRQSLRCCPKSIIIFSSRNKVLKCQGTRRYFNIFQYCRSGV